LARVEAPAYQRHYIDYRFGPQARMQSASGPEELTPAATLFSNVSSAVPRDLIGRYPLREDIMIAEDLEWCGRVLLAGYRVQYVPESVVRHSHDYSLPALFRRYFDQGVASRDTLHRGEGSASAVRSEGFRYARGELSWLWRQGHRSEVPGALAWEAARYAGFRLGTHHRALPMSLRRRLSRLPTYWD
jgi:rhamnosyltransferase